MKNFPHVFTPFKFGNLTVKNRIEIAPAIPCLASHDGFVTRELVEYYKGLARGGAGIVCIGDTPIDFEYAKDHEQALNLGDDRVIAGLSTLVEAIHRYGAKASIELNHGGRFAEPRTLAGRSPIAPSPIPSETAMMWAQMHGVKLEYQVTEMNQQHIDTAVAHYAEACNRCLQAGMEMVLLHGAHGHLLAQFLSPYSNKRTDKYGGSLQNRARFAIEVITAVRKSVGNKLAIEYRISADELIPDGLHPDEVIEFVKMIEDQIDLLHVSAGMLTNPMTIPQMIQPTYLPRAYNVHYAEQFKKALKVPITTVGSIDIETADRLLGEGKCDMVAMVRPIIADTDYVNKKRLGKSEEIRPCLRCNTCIQKVAQFYPIRCAVNPVIGREMEYAHIHPAEKVKKVVIVGGGPAGLQAAIAAANRGHKVVLFEKEKNLGGALNLAAAHTFKTDMRNYCDWLTRTAANTPGIIIKLNTQAQYTNIKAEKPDVVIMAVGAEPLIPNLPGMDQAKVVSVRDFISGKAAIGANVAVAGAGLTGCEAALELAQQGKKVTLVDMLPFAAIASDAAFLNKLALLGLLNQNGVQFKNEVTITGITERGLQVKNGRGNVAEIPVDTIVLSLGVKAVSIAEEIKDLAPEVYIIGDCACPSNIIHAVHDGFNVAVEL